MEKGNTGNPQDQETENCQKNVVYKKNIDEIINAKQNSLDEEKRNLIQNIDFCDFTFSSFNDFLLGECSYLEDLSINHSSSDFIERIPISFHNSNFKQINKNNNLIVQDNCKGENPNKQQKSAECLNQNFISADNYNFYHVFELIENPITQAREIDAQKQSIITTSLPCKTNKNSRHKKKRKTVAAAIRKGQRYLPNFKQKVLEYASNHTFKATALHFNINCNTITEWARANKRLSIQQKSTMSVSASVNDYKTEIDNTSESAKKTDIILLKDSFTIETELNDNVIKQIEQDLPSGYMRSDERFLTWIKNKRTEKKELSRREVFCAAQFCLNKCLTNTENPVWFILWLKRYNKSLQKSEKTDQETEKYIMYPNNFKFEVILYAKLFTKNSAAKVFNVPRRRIFEWYKCPNDLNNSALIHANNNNFTQISSNSTADKKDILEDSSKIKKSKKEIYTELHDWYRKRFSEGFSPTSNEIKEKARELFAANGISYLKFSEGWLQKFCKRLNIKLRYTDDDRLLLWILAQFDNNVSLSHQEITEKSSKLIVKKKQFKGSKGWTLRFLKRHSKFLQNIPTIEDKLPAVVQGEIKQFCDSIRLTVKSLKINSCHIGCMDEIPINLSYPQDGKEDNLPLLRKTGFESCQAVVILCMLADGRTLPPAVVFRGTEPRRILSSGNIDFLIFYQEKGLVDLDIVESWMNNIWIRYVSSPNILIVDSFKSHCSDDLKEKLIKANCKLSVIPEGCSSQLQPLDIEISPKFKDIIKSQWREYESNDVSYSSKVSKRCRYPDQEIILTWIGNAYRKIEENPRSIINSFKIVGFID